jgi:hypothetical protein
MTINKSVREYRNLLLEALESGEYKQGKDRLRTLSNNTFCCLGVACDVYDIKNNKSMWRQEEHYNRITYSGYVILPPVSVLNEYAISDSTMRMMMNWNDIKGFSFIEIAAKLRKLWNMPKENQ